MADKKHDTDAPEQHDTEPEPSVVEVQRGERLIEFVDGQPSGNTRDITLDEQPKADDSAHTDDQPAATAEPEQG